MKSKSLNLTKANLFWIFNLGVFMKILQTLALAVLSVSSMSSMAQVTLNVGENTIVTAINGQEVKNSLFAEPKRTFTLEAGKHVITAKYQRLYDLQGDNHDVLRSSNISLPVELADNQSYELIMANQPEYYNQAKEYAKQPTLAIRQNGNVLASQQATDSNQGGIFSGLGTALGGMFGGGNKAVQANQQVISALEGKSANTVPALATPSVSNDSLDQFMQLWLKATPEEREKIRQWVQK